MVVYAISGSDKRINPGKAIESPGQGCTLAPKNTKSGGRRAAILDLLLWMAPALQVLNR